LQYCEVMGRTLLFHRKDGEVLDSIGRLDDLCEQLKDYEQFVRCHRSYLINMEHVEHYEYDNVVMKDKTRLSISKANRKKVRERLLQTEKKRL